MKWLTPQPAGKSFHLRAFEVDSMKMTYGEQLKHPLWQRKRLEVLNAAGFACQRCYDADTTLHVHHKHYVKGRMAWEYEPRELVALCEPCHGEAHEEKERFNDLLACLPEDGPGCRSNAAALIAGWAGGHVSEDLGNSFMQESPSEFELGGLANRIDNASGMNIETIMYLAECFLEDDFVRRLKAFLDSYVPAGRACQAD